MNLLLKLLPKNLPAFIREEILSELFRATAEAFGCATPAVEHLSYADCLRAYALFTREQAEQALQSGRDIQVIKTHLYRSAYPLGAMLRDRFGVDSMAEVMALGQVLYQAIGVDITGDAEGNVTVSRCYFSQFYSAPVCDLISALDDGVFSGLSGGGRLAFSERITSGSPAARARLSTREEGIQ
ncbi:MAG: hypothetical protein EHM21_17725 [Chloroflexi bacterium]|nr:MAG: hypothetical protein EHM21_17725 [Chloroflexota bacterium]